MTELSDAVSALVDIRPVVTDQEPGEAHDGGIHVETHASLLSLLFSGDPGSNNSGSSDPGLPIDREALELQQRFSDELHERCLNARSPYSRDNLKVTAEWWARAVDSLNEEPEVYAENIAWAGWWVYRIEAKFERRNGFEFTDKCPVEGCGRRWVESPDGDRIPAIWVNATTLTAECQGCGSQWIGLAQLEVLANPSKEWVDLPTGERVKLGVIEHLVGGDTPKH